MSLSVVILAAGKGTRMRSAKPKVLQPLAGRPMIQHIIDTARSAKPDSIYVVVGHLADEVTAAIDDSDVHAVPQKEQLGTGHAVLEVLPLLPKTGHTLILNGDLPLLTQKSLLEFIKPKPEHCRLMTASVQEPKGLGRIIRDENAAVTAIIEEKDADAKTLALNEIYSGCMLVSNAFLHQFLPMISPNNQQKEYYLTDLVDLAVSNKLLVEGHILASETEAYGVNDRQELARAERVLQQRIVNELMQQGVHFYDPSRFDCRGSLQTGQDVSFDVNVVCEGEVIIGDGCKIGPNVYLANVRLGNNVEVLANSVIDGAVIGNFCRIGPFARIRPGSEFAEHAHVGNFVEVKNAQVGANSKMNHLSYIGDATLGQDVNIGAGTITCNYDGANKHRTHIGDNVHIGSDTQLIAPISVGEGATIGAGSTLRKNAPAHMLTLSRSEQIQINHWKRPKKQE